MDKDIDKKEKILEVSKKLFLREGFTNTTIRQISREAEFKNQSSIYYYFGNKEDIVTTMISRFYIKTIGLIKELNIDEQDYLLIFSIIQLVVLRRLYMIPKSRNLVIESEKHLDLQIIVTATQEYTDIVYKIVDTYVKEMKLGKIHYYINIYLGGIERTFKNIENNSLNMTLDEACGNLQTLFLELIGIDKEIIKDKNLLAEHIYESIDEKRLQTISLV